uniref:Lipocalin/cytosolic fatty-acid binding domain-containing protein n=1 Tax=Leptocylindrus danicus TaxID=163516 RepID=A0A7S2KR17_9STRA
MGNFTSNSSTALPPLKTVTSCNVDRFATGAWFVIGNIPTYPERHASNAVERYALTQGKKSNDIDIDFQYNNGDPITGKLKSLPQKGWLVKDEPGEWRVSPFWPLKLPYLILELDTDRYNYCVIGYPNRNYAWIMGRKPVMDGKLYDSLVDKLVKDHQYDVSKLRKVPQKWTAEERKKRGVSVDECPDEMLATD